MLNLFFGYASRGATRRDIWMNEGNCCLMSLIEEFGSNEWRYLHRTGGNQRDITMIFGEARKDMFDVFILYS